MEMKDGNRFLRILFEDLDIPLINISFITIFFSYMSQEMPLLRILYEFCLFCNNDNKILWLYLILSAKEKSVLSK